MQEFMKYPHLERFGTDEVEQIELGKCFVFPKLDGTNASVWVNDKLQVCAGSRNRELSFEKDNAGFLDHVSDNSDLKDFLLNNPNIRLYGEWLVPHSLKTYRDTAWRTFYVFDVYCHEKERFLTFDEYECLLAGSNIEFIYPIAVITNPSYEQLQECMNKNTFLINDGLGVGEGVVVKNYAYQNKYGRKTWAKLVTNEFKEKHVKAMGPSIMSGTKMIEQEIVDEFVTPSLVDKTYDKIRVENDGFSGKNIPELLNRVYHDLVTEDLWQIIKKKKNPSINFKTLFTLTIQSIKAQKPAIFGLA